MARTKKGSANSSEPKIAKKPGQGKRLPSQAKHIIHNVRESFEREKSKGSCIKRLSVVDRTAEATGISARTINRIHQEFISREGQLAAAHSGQAIWGFTNKNKPRLV